MTCHLTTYRASRSRFSVIIFHDYLQELLHHGRGAGEEEMTEIEVVSGETTLILHRDISVVVAENNRVCKAKMLTVNFAK